MTEFRATTEPKRRAVRSKAAVLGLATALALTACSAKADDRGDTRSRHAQASPSTEKAPDSGSTYPSETCENEREPRYTIAYGLESDDINTLVARGAVHDKMLRRYAQRIQDDIAKERKAGNIRGSDQIAISSNISFSDSKTEGMARFEARQITLNLSVATGLQMYDLGSVYESTGDVGVVYIFAVDAQACDVPEITPPGQRV